MVRENDSRVSDDNFLEINYRTCLYANQSMTILIAVDSRNQSLANLVNEEELKESTICEDLLRLLENQMELLIIGKDLSNKIKTIKQETEDSVK